MTKRIDPLTVDVRGHVECLLGNEAIVRGAIESGVGFASGYPGTPSSEVTDSFARISKGLGITFEYSINEKIALEMAFAASIGGTRSICAMKHLGLIYAGDPLSTIPYIGAVAGMVIVAAGDPSCRVSPNEQDQRYFGPMLHIPVLDPSTPKEAYEMTLFAFELSEKCSLPVILRPTTRVCHSKENIEYGPLEPPKNRGFVRDPQRFVPVPNNARRLRQELNTRMDKAEKMVGESEFIHHTDRREIAIIGAGAPAATAFDVFDEAGLKDRVMMATVGCQYPIPEKQILELLEGVKRALIVEELSPYLEDSIRALCKKNGVETEIVGKRTGDFPVEFEYTPELIKKGIASGLELDVGATPDSERQFSEVVPRPPTLCPGCPHRPAQFAARTVIGEDTLFFNDIGCYTLGYGPPLNAADSLLCMGAGFTLAAGVSQVTGKRTVGLMGDSTFFHSGMPALLNAIKENVNMVALILDNHVTAMTGFQESPGITIENGKLSRDVDIAGTVRALGAKSVEIFDPYDFPASIKALEDARDADGLSVVIAERSCPSFLAKEMQKPYVIGSFEIDHTVCRTCGREADGRRCNNCISEGFERHMAVARARETTSEPLVLPPRAPCSMTCPVDLCIQGYLGHISAGEFESAFNTIMEQLPLPDSICRVCHAPCEADCIRADIDEALSIKELKRFVMDWAAENNLTYAPEMDPSSGKKVAVVGAGPSGLAAAHDLKLRGFDVTVFDKSNKPGGLLTSGIPSYRLPLDALERDVKRVLDLGIAFEGGRVLGDDLVLDELLDNGFDAVYLAFGAHRGMALKVDGIGEPNTPPLWDALKFLKDVNAGVKVEVGKKVVVIGGGNAAIDAARTAKRLGAGEVTIVYRREQADMPAIEEEVEAALGEGIILEVHTGPVALNPKGLVVVRTEPGASDQSGRQRPVSVTGSERLVAADQVIAAIGQSIDVEGLKVAGKELEVENDGSIKMDRETHVTSCERVFAGGDNTDGPRTAIDAIAFGRRAAWGIDRLLRGEEEADRRPPPQSTAGSSTFDDGDPRSRHSLGEGGQTTRTTDRRPRQYSKMLPEDKRTTTFDEVVLPLTEKQAQIEASRCMVCGTCGNCRVCIDLFGCPAFYVSEGRIEIDAALCMGCGVCAEICPNGAIKRVGEAGGETK